MLSYVARGMTSEQGGQECQSPLAQPAKQAQRIRAAGGLVGRLGPTPYKHLSQALVLMTGSSIQGLSDLSLLGWFPLRRKVGGKGSPHF